MQPLLKQNKAVLKKRKCLFYLGILLVSLLAGCQHVPQKISPQHKPLTQWLLTGKLGIHVNQRAASAAVIWRQQLHNYDLTLQGPLGIGALHITGTPQAATLSTPNTTQSIQPIERFIEQQFGWSIPVEHLLWWMQGLPAPELLFTEARYDHHSRLTHFKQQDWNITLKNYQTTSLDNAPTNTIDLPYQIILSKKSIRLTLLISHWQELDF